MKSLAGAELSLAGKSTLPVVLCTKTFLTSGEMLLYALLIFNYRKSEECRKLDTSDNPSIKYKCVNNMCISNGKSKKLEIS